ncbi:RWD domain-containing protein 1 [Halyomorpha halys]|uniref:RWD domain-containing protein 1 n=1 Tax=Halyomorpha halys TaxID=286706 RepID=UPI0006D4D337|nr:RWD domain-containing protein 1 [Halyomorpha halys]
MDHKEEQINEIEALESIYCGEMEIITTEPYHAFVIPIKSDDYEEGVAGIHCCLRFEYTELYPEEPPIIDIETEEDFEFFEPEELKNHIIEQANENLGMVMIFTLVSVAQEWVNEKNDLAKITKVEREEKKKLEEEEAERKKFEGTRVTVESFLIWKQKFDEDMGFISKKEINEKGKKMTGRELFMLDKSLNESDLKFLEEGGEFVKVDESLFQDIEDLGIDEDLVSDED